MPRAPRSLTEWRAATALTASAPTLWRVRSNSAPGLPRPTASRSAGSPVRGTVALAGGAAAPSSPRRQDIAKRSRQG